MPCQCLSSMAVSVHGTILPCQSLALTYGWMYSKGVNAPISMEIQTFILHFLPMAKSAGSHPSNTLPESVKHLWSQHMFSAISQHFCLLFMKQGSVEENRVECEVQCF